MIENCLYYITYIHRLHTCIEYHTYIHTCLPTYLPTYLHTYMHTYIRTYIHTLMHTHIYAYTHIHTYTNACFHIPQPSVTITIICTRLFYPSPLRLSDQNLSFTSAGSPTRFT